MSGVRDAARGDMRHIRTNGRGSCATLALACISFACAASAKREPSVREHRAEATRHEAEADRIDDVPEELQARGYGHPFVVYTNDEAYVEWLRAHAQDHRRAAEQLEATEVAACGAIPTSLRASCPLMTYQIDLVAASRSGVGLRVKLGYDGEQITRDLACHQAHAEARGLDDDSRCPFLVHGLSISLLRAGGQSWILLTTHERDDRLRLDRAIDVMFGGK